MAATLLINPREALEALEKSGMPKKQATEVVKIFEDINVDHLATKTDLSALETRLTARIYGGQIASVVAVVGALKFFGLF